MNIHARRPRHPLLAGSLLGLLLTVAHAVSAAPLLLLLDAPGAAPADAAAKRLARAGAEVLRAADAASAIVAIDRARRGPAVLIAEGVAAATARHVAASRPDLVRGVVLIAEPPAAGTEARRDSPVGAVLRINAGGADDEFGSRATDLRIDGGDGALLGTRTDATVDAILRWIDGPSLSSAQAGRRIEQPTDVAAMSAEQRRLDQALRESLQTAAGRRVGVLGPRGVLLNDPRLLQGYLGIGDAVANAPVPLRYKELAILLTARALDSDYEWYAHERPALNAGVPPDAVAAIRRGQPHRFARADDQIVYDYVDEFHRTHHVSDTTYRRAWDLLGTAGLVNLTMVVGHYMGVATNLNAHGLRPPGDFTPLPLRTTR